ncbi:MAG TPA: NADH-ubiquinone oxidoreductase-F iron-sulfur binding region domain-containing protein [Acidimicrobiales bacterium]|nr:NADH-ubiquinone oxidoreductase-F iron-sulfur binding region domain-containing protein [Acidimicrobiales bacterium]
MTATDARPAPPLLAPGPSLAAHLAVHGPLPRVGAGLVDLARRADLRGRGGAAFPTATKLAAVAAAGGDVVVANGTEGEPLSGKDKVLLTASPHLVIDGLHLAAAAVGASRRIICVERGHPAVERAVRAALAERRDHSIEVVPTPRRYVAGQETALVDWIDGGPGRPTLDLPFVRGVGGRPTLVDNVETLAALAVVARWGPAGAARMLVTVAGDVTRPGVREADVGSPISELLDAAGAVRPRAVLVGGYFGTWVPAAAARSTPLLGGVVAALGTDSCALAELARVAEWFAASSAGQCGACTWGLRDLAAATAATHGGSPDRRAVADIRRWTAMVRGRGACKLPDGAAGFLASGIEVFADEIAEHRAGTCRRSDRRLLPVPPPEPFR